MDAISPVLNHGTLLVASADDRLIADVRAMDAGVPLDFAVVSRGRDLVEMLRPRDLLPHEGEAGSVRIVLLDDDLSDRRGLAILRLIRAERPDLKVIYAAAGASASLEVEARREGAYFYLPKPVSIEILRKVVAKAVAHESTRNRWKVG